MALTTIQDISQYLFLIFFHLYAYIIQAKQSRAGGHKVRLTHSSYEHIHVRGKVLLITNMD